MHCFIFPAGAGKDTPFLPDWARGWLFLPFGCVCESALLKSARKGVIVSEARCAQENSAQADDVFLLKKEELPVSMGKMCAGENGMNLKNITGQRGMPFAGVPLFYN